MAGDMRRAVGFFNRSVRGCYGDNNLYTAIEEAKWSQVLQLLEDGETVEAITPPTPHANERRVLVDHPIHLALKYKDVPLEVVQKLITPENINAFNKFHGHTPLLMAVNIRRWDLVEELIKRGADINKKSRIGTWPIHLACDMKNVPREIILMLLSKENVNACQSDGCTALHLVVLRGKWEFVDDMLQHGADIDAKTYVGDHPLHDAVRQPNIPLVHLRKLLSPHNINTANGEGRTPDKVYTSVGVASEGRTPLSLLAQNQLEQKEGLRPLLTCLLEAGAKPSLHDIVEVVMNRFDADVTQCLLQHLNESYELHHVEFVFSTPDDRYNDRIWLHINDEILILEEMHPSAMLPRIDIICTLLQEMSIIKSQRTTPTGNINTAIADEIVRHCIQKHSEFTSICQQPPSMKKLCCAQIRHTMNMKTDKVFSSLGVPPSFIGLLTYNGLAQDLSLMCC